MDNLIFFIFKTKGKLEDQTETEDKSIDGFATVQESNVGRSKVTRKWTDDELCAQCLIFVSF